MSFWKWSRTASSNSSADGSINWAEGQAPSSVNDSARAMMAAAAKFRDDISGAISTGGTSTAYTVFSYQSFDTLAHLDSAMIAFTPHTGNGATVTLNVDSLGAKPLRSAPSVELQTGTLIQGTPYVATYNNSDGVFYLQGGASNPYNIPLGGMLPYAGFTAPNSAFVLPFGQAISRSTYATLFNQVSTAFGSGDGSTTFNLPDLRGRIVAGVDNMGGSNAARLNTMSSTTLGGVGGEQTHVLTQSELASHGHTGTTSTETASHNHQFGLTFGTVAAGGGSAITNLAQSLSAGGSTSVTTTQNESANHQHTFTSDATGSSAAHNNIQPTMTLMYIMRII